MEGLETEVGKRHLAMRTEIFSRHRNPVEWNRLTSVFIVQHSLKVSVMSQTDPITFCET